MKSTTERIGTETVERFVFNLAALTLHKHSREETSTLNGLNNAMMKHACAIVKRVAYSCSSSGCDAHIFGICTPKTVETNYEWDFKFTGVLVAHQPLPHSNNNNNY